MQKLTAVIARCTLPWKAPALQPAATLTSSLKQGLDRQDCQLGTTAQLPMNKHRAFKQLRCRSSRDSNKSHLQRWRGTECDRGGPQINQRVRAPKCKSTRARHDSARPLQAENSSQLLVQAQDINEAAACSALPQRQPTPRCARNTRPRQAQNNIARLLHPIGDTHMRPGSHQKYTVAETIRSKLSLLRASFQEKIAGTRWLIRLKQSEERLGKGR